MIKTDTRSFIRSYRVRDDGKLVIELGTGENVITDINELEKVRTACQKEIKGLNKLIQNQSSKLNKLKLIEIASGLVSAGTLTSGIGMVATGNAGALMISSLGVSALSMATFYKTRNKLKEDTIALAQDKKHVKSFTDDIDKSISKENEYKYKMNNRYTINNNYEFIEPYKNTKNKVKTLTKA